ncbi:hypothetical protein [Nocardia sp. NPDC059239]|uniref:hypothetical protein n=1 Tax=unclassified Nocardia TaxID=2637762 RepID=UPI0036909528
MSDTGNTQRSPKDAAAQQEHATTPVVFLDTETTGLHAERRPWEIAMIRRDGAERREMSMFIWGVDLSGAEAEALRIGRFYQRHPQYRAPLDTNNPWPRMIALDPGERVEDEQSAAWIVERWTRGATVFGVNPGFDLGTLAPMLRRHELAPSWHYTPVDIKTFAMGWLHGLSTYSTAPDLDGLIELTPLGATRPAALDLPWKSGEVSQACDVVQPGDADKHTALGDALWVERWWDRITGASQGGAR